MGEALGASCATTKMKNVFECLEIEDASVSSSQNANNCNDAFSDSDISGGNDFGENYASETQPGTINLLGFTNDEQQRQYTLTMTKQEEDELNEAVAELTDAIEKNPNLTKIQKEFFLELAADPEGNNEGSAASYNTQSSTLGFIVPFVGCGS